MATVAGIIFSNLHDRNIPELTNKRTMASVPFACRYRLIDFALSNMVNADITNISVITHYNYHSLMDHIGSGKDWDLARRSGGIKILPPFITAYANQSNTLYNSRLEALLSVGHSLRFREQYVVLSDCDAICNIDLDKMIEDHIENGADITIAVKKINADSYDCSSTVVYKADGNGNINGIELYNPSLKGEQYVTMNIMVMSTSYLQELLLDASAHNYTSFTRNIIAENISKRKFRIYRHSGYFASVDSFNDYFALSLGLAANKQNRDELFGQKNRPIFTKVRNSPPTKYINGAEVKNSLIADGCIIEGIVENSILFRGVKIGKNTVVKNSILFQDTFTGENVYLNCVVTDKNVSIRDGRVLSGHETMPFYIEKGKMI